MDQASRAEEKIQVAKKPMTFSQFIHKGVNTWGAQNKTTNSSSPGTQSAQSKNWAGLMTPTTVVGEN